MKTQRFIEQSKATATRLLYAYFIENNMEKVQACFSRQNPSFIGWGRQEVFCGYDNIFHTLTIRMHEIQRSRIQKMQVYVPYATASRCIVLVNCHISTELHTGYSLDIDCRMSFVLVNENDTAKILQLTVSVPPTTADIAVTATKRRHITAKLAADAAEYSPNGLKCCLTDAEYTATYVNRSLAVLAGYQAPQELLAATQGQLQNLVDARDLPKVQQAMQSLAEEGSTYTINYRLRTKQAGFVWILERGRRTLGMDGEPCIICAASPLLQPEDNSSYDLPQLPAPSYEIPTEAFLNISLDIVSSNTRAVAMQQLLQLASDLLQLAGIWVTDIRQSSQPMKLAAYYDASGMQPSELFLEQTGDEILSFFNTNGFAQCSDTRLLPAKYRPNFTLQGIRSFCQRLIKIEGQNAYIATFYQRDSQHSFTAHELEIICMTSQVISVLLNQDFFSEEHI